MSVGESTTGRIDGTVHVHAAPGQVSLLQKPKVIDLKHYIMYPKGPSEMSLYERKVLF
jgi:hypothetical protein